MPRIVVITPPSQLLTAAEVRARLGVTDPDAVLDPLIRAACAEIEPPNGWVGRSFGRQTLEMRTGWFADHWGGCELRLRHPPVYQVDSVKYIDAGGVEQTLAASGYEVHGDVIRLAYGASWPSTRFGPEAVRVRYQAGYASGDPKLEPARSAVALMVRELLSLAKRDPALSSDNVPGVGSQNYIFSEATAKVLRGAVENLLQGYRVFA